MKCKCFLKSTQSILEIIRTITKTTSIGNSGTKTKQKSESSTTSSPTKESTTLRTNTTIPTTILQEFTEADLEDPNFKCTAKAAFKVDCNTCWCASNGREPKTCTRIACKPSVYEPLN